MRWKKMSLMCSERPCLRRAICENTQSLLVSRWRTSTIKQGVERELAQRIVKAIKAAKIKAQVSIQGDELRVSGKKRDDLQNAIALVKGLEITQPLQYVNFRD